MAGEGVLHECLLHEQVEQVLIINRKPSGIQHLKLKEIIHADFFDLAPVADQLRGYNGCFFCLSISSIGMKEQEYHKLTYLLTLYFSGILVKQNREMVFCYISGAATDSSEKGKVMWARVKGKTENDLLKLPFKQVYTFRPGFIKPTKGLKNALKFYKYINWLYPAFRLLFPKHVSTLRELGLAMIQAAIKGYPKNKLEVKDIVKLANQQ